MTSPFDETTIGSDGRSRLLTRREVYARALLKVLQNPEGLETIDWQLADAAMAVADIEAELLISALSASEEDLLS